MLKQHRSFKYYDTIRLFTCRSFATRGNHTSALSQQQGSHWLGTSKAQDHPRFRHAQNKRVRTAFQKLGVKGQKKIKHYIATRLSRRFWWERLNWPAKWFTPGGCSKVSQNGRTMPACVIRTTLAYFRKQNRQIRLDERYTDEIRLICTDYIQSRISVFLKSNDTWLLNERNFAISQSAKLHRWGRKTELESQLD